MSESEQESSLASCLSLSSALIDSEITESNKDIERIILKNLVYRYQTLNSEEQFKVLVDLGLSFLNSETDSDITRPDFTNIMVDQQNFHIGIITIIQEELEAILSVLALNPQYEDEKINGFPYWFGQIQRDNLSDLNVVVTMVGQPRNVPCAIAVDQLLNNFNIETLLLSGIAAGVEGEVDIGDVIYAERVMDYEHKRLELKYFKKLFFGNLEEPIARMRPRFIESNHAIKIDLQRLTSTKNLEEFHRTFESLLEGKDASGKYNPKLKKGTTAAGEKLLADGSLHKLKDNDQRIKCANQEDSGFAQACETRKINWVIFRGVSDFGTAGSKPPGVHNNHIIAANSAAAASFIFLKNVWKEEDYKPLSLGDVRNAVEPT